MNIFNKIPENFFSILVSKNKNIYIDALFVLREAFKQEMTISRENIISRLINNLEDEFYQEEYCIFYRLFTDAFCVALSDLSGSGKAFPDCQSQCRNRGKPAESR